MRLAALERVQDLELLEQVVRQSRNRDKRVYRQAKERLTPIKQLRPKRRASNGCAMKWKTCAGMVKAGLMRVGSRSWIRNGEAMKPGLPGTAGAL